MNARLLRGTVLTAALALAGCPGATTCYSYCADMSVVATSCADAGAAAQCSSVQTQAFSGSTQMGGLSLLDCSTVMNDAGALVDAGCSPPTFQCVASGCNPDIDCSKVANCTAQ